jgi:N-acetylglutamate synthase-like GNAT family acetyltransferase
MTDGIHRGGNRDVPALATLINLAYEAERFFVEGDRTDDAEVARELRAGTFLVVRDGDDVIGCVHVAIDSACGTFGMLAVHPSRQGQGIGRRLIAAAETLIQEHGVRRVRILVVNLREDLLRIYGRLGYSATSTEPYVHRPTLQPCHFVVMVKSLEGSGRL